MKHVVHVHQQKIRKGEPAIIDRTYKGSRHGTRATVQCNTCGSIVGRFTQLEQPDACGARVTFETVHSVDLS